MGGMEAAAGGCSPRKPRHQPEQNRGVGAWTPKFPGSPLPPPRVEEEWPRSQAGEQI